MTRDLRVLFVHSTAERYGSDRSLLLLASGLRRRHVSVAVCLPARGPLADDLAKAGVETHFVPVGAFRRVFTPLGWLRYVLWDLPASVLAVARLARSADLVHVNTSVLLGGALGARVARRPLVWHIRESYAGRRLWRFYARLIRFIAHAVVCNSRSIAAEAEHFGVAPDVVPNAVQFSSPVPAPPQQGPVVTVGRINEGKGQTVLVEAVALLRERGLTVPVVIAGDVFPGAEVWRHRLEASIESSGMSGQVRLLGFVDDVRSLLRSSSVFVLPSVRPEGFGLALLEAMGEALPCIATSAGGPAEILRDGETGLLVPPGDAHALASAIAGLWEDEELRDRLGQAAARDVRARYSPDATVGLILDVYARVLAGERD